MKLSHADVGDVVMLMGKDKEVYLVTSRTAEDRTSGDTELWSEKLGTVTVIWDERNPEVIVIGKGRREQKLVMV